MAGATRQSADRSRERGGSAVAAAPVGPLLTVALPAAAQPSSQSILDAILRMQAHMDAQFGNITGRLTCVEASVAGIAPLEQTVAQLSTRVNELEAKITSSQNDAFMGYGDVLSLASSAGPRADTGAAPRNIGQPNQTGFMDSGLFKPATIIIGGLPQTSTAL